MIKNAIVLLRNLGIEVGVIARYKRSKQFV